MFLIRRAIPGIKATYKVQEWDGTRLEGTFYEQDLQPLTAPDDGLFRIEKILQRKGKLAKVRWQGKRFASGKGERIMGGFYVTLPSDP